jgi:hypothetical protein
MVRRRIASQRGAFNGWKKGQRQAEKTRMPKRQGLQNM